MMVALNTQGQTKIIRGVVIDSASGDPMASVSVANIGLQTGIKTDRKGSFSIEIANDTYLRFSYLGYQDKILRLDRIDDVEGGLEIIMKRRRKSLPQVTIKKALTPYQQDSIERREIYKDIFDYETEKSIQSPVTSVYQKFSKKHKNLRAFQEQVLEMERQKYVDSKYKVELVERVTKLEGEALADFMNAYPMEFKFARGASELEVDSWVRYNWAEYKKKKRLD